MRTLSVAIVAIGIVASSSLAAEKLGIGNPISPDEMRGWDIDVRADGEGLPVGSGTAARGRSLFADRCAKCHGDEGQGAEKGPPLKGGMGTLATANPIKTIGSFWPYAPPIFDYIRRAMPLDASQSLTPDEAYSLTAFLLHINGLFADQSAELSVRNLPLITMPNRNGFVADDREVRERSLWNRAPCMRNCEPFGKAAAR